MAPAHGACDGQVTHVARPQGNRDAIPLILLVLLAQDAHSSVLIVLEHHMFYMQ
jgi:hypothetical protein